MVGEFDQELKAEIDTAQECIDHFWKAGLDKRALKWIAYKDELTQKIGMDDQDNECFNHLDE